MKNPLCVRYTALKIPVKYTLIYFSYAHKVENYFQKNRILFDFPANCIKVKVEPVNLTTLNHVTR